MAYYWCSTTDLGDETALENGGYYEKIDETGVPVSRSVGGFARSDVPEVCMSHSPEACLFALAHNTGSETRLHVYRTTTDPDIDLSNAGWDFDVLEEVRYRNPSDNPIHLVRSATVVLPQRAFDDASESYNPHGPYQDATGRDAWNSRPVFNRQWAVSVKDALRRVLDGEQYPETIDFESPYDDWPRPPDA